MRFATDTGGTFTDLIVQDGADMRMYKAATVPADPVSGVLDALRIAAQDAGEPLDRYLRRGRMFIHGTTHAINAIITGRTARTALLATQGHPDVLVLREGGRREPFNFTVQYPKPYVPRRLTFEVPERIDSAGRIATTLDEAAVLAIIERLREEKIEAVAVCLLWSILNPVHERRVGELIRKHLPGVKLTLSHELNPSIREYPRAVSACIDASLKPKMDRYLGELEQRLRAAGFSGRVLVLTSQAGMLDAEHLARTPIHAINSGPSTAPIAGRHYATSEAHLPDAIIADTGGTTYDVSLVRDGHIPFTRESWLGQPFRSDMTGFPSVDVKSIGAGGGSIAWIDEGGVLHVGPDSAGAVPGPVCYRNGGTRATLTDACVVLGYIDPGYFLGGTLTLDAAAARDAVKVIADSLRMSPERAAAAIVDVATENMVQAIADITIHRGIDPARACLIGGGGAAGLNSVLIARRLGCPLLIIPSTGAALSAAGALMADVSSEFRRMYFAVSSRFDTAAVNELLTELRASCEHFAKTYGHDALSHEIEFAVEARYQSQVWEIELPMGQRGSLGPQELRRLMADFHALHERIYAVCDPRSPIEFVTWIARVHCKVASGERRLVAGKGGSVRRVPRRKVFFNDTGEVDAFVSDLHRLEVGAVSAGPAVIETPFTTIVIPPGAQYLRTEGDSLVIHPTGRHS